MTNYLITNPKKFRVNRRTGRVRGAIPLKAVDSLLRSKKTSPAVKAAWRKKLAKPIKSVKLKSKVKQKGKTTFYTYNGHGLKIAKPR